MVEVMEGARCRFAGFAGDNGLDDFVVVCQSTCNPLDLYQKWCFS